MLRPSRWDERYTGHSPVHGARNIREEGIQLKSGYMGRRSYSLCSAHRKAALQRVNEGRHPGRCECGEYWLREQSMVATNTCMCRVCEVNAGKIRWRSSRCRYFTKGRVAELQAANRYYRPRHDPWRGSKSVDLQKALHLLGGRADVPRCSNSAGRRVLIPPRYLHQLRQKWRRVLRVIRN